VRDAADALVSTQPFEVGSRIAYLQRVSRVLQWRQRRNEQARRCHERSRCRRLRALGLITGRMRSCIPP
jgi:hypothetical protein